ncbi:MAG: HD-GYP domain-containing protein [Chloroflexota bacterium]
MSSLPWKARIYISLLAALMAGAVFFSIPEIGNHWDYWSAIFVFGGTVAVLDILSISHVGVHMAASIANAIKFAVVLLYPMPVAIISVFWGTLAGEIPVQRVWYKKLFNVAQMTLTWVIAAWVYNFLNNPQESYLGSVGNVFAIVSAAATAFLLNIALLCLVISFAANLPLQYVIAQNTRVMVWHEASLFTLGIFFAVLWRYSPATIVLAVIPLFFVRDAYKTANHLRNQTQDALRALIQVVDERDHHTHDHSERVSNYARAMAKSLALSQDEIEVIASAALLHDLGKVGMADDILYNPKLLNPNEKKNAEQHAAIGGALLAKFPLFDRGAVLVRHHHERYDGNGYPDRLKGEDIPLGARIISVADSYQAMTEDRPYRRALTQAEAVAQLAKNSGTQFDPRVVQAFIGILQENLPKEKLGAATIPQSSETG